ncbi:uncharacterized protein DFL_003618 [Arthrobotrys flagrans]|uniref:Uncharacterized protein n=1 Tax=Arthrobotrys flagrans TaxID=97331 RepID=A0A437A2F1_ARTFL|nr:hypothetical protein DFL_003618 [Arthrobotrys flagrans]
MQDPIESSRRTTNRGLTYPTNPNQQLNDNDIVLFSVHQYPNTYRALPGSIPYLTHSRLMPILTTVILT